MAKQVEYNASVVSRLDINSFLIILGIKPDQQPYPFKPGQYTTLALKASTPRVKEATAEANPKTGDDAIQRAYSVASANTTGVLDFYLALVSHGELTPRLFSLNVGDRVYVGPKATGLFTLEKIEEQKSLLFMATGTGLAPYISMLRSNFDWSKGRKVVVLHGVRHSSDLGYREELEELAKTQKNFFYMPVISQPSKDPTWQGLGGYLQDVLFSGEVSTKTGLKVSPDNFDVFICGNPAMIESSITKLNEVGFILAKGRTPGTIHIEEYW
jgi:ferredoxin--NADP+ reductase